jgi:5-methyltetrahydrofolate--homocysteine methyltransferase
MATQELISAFIALDYQKVKELVKEMLNSGISASEILKSMQEGMVAIGKKYEEGEYFLSELMAAGEIMKAGLEELMPHLIKGTMPSVGTVVIGTVKGDIHDVGKNLVKVLLQSSGFNVYDLGVDVPPEEFVNKVKEANADILALSALLTTTMNQARLVIEELKKAKLRDKVKVIVGGNPITEEFGKEIGADAAVRDAMHGIRICTEWVKGGRKWSKK